MPLCQLNWRERMEKIKPSLTSVFFILLTLLLILSCFRPQLQKTQAKGIYHLVEKNETVWMIASAYNVKLQDLVEINNITDLNSIKEGSIVFIPDANNVKDLAKKDTGKEGKTAIEAPTVENKKEALPIVTSPKTQQPKAALREEPQLSEVIPARKQSDEKIEPRPKTKSPAEGMQIDKKKFIWGI